MSVRSDRTKAQRDLPARRHAPRKPARKRGFFRRWWWLFVLMPAVAFLALVATLLYVYVRVQLPNAPPQKQTTYLYDTNGKLIATLHAGENRTNIPLSDTSQVLRQAVIDTEDAGFYHHGGVSPFAIVRAAIADLTHRGIVQGGSTITQQYVKIVYTGSERTVFRKIKEAILAIKLEHRYTKDQILEKYLNTVYFGHGAYGVQAAAETYFKVPATKLSLLQSATIAGTIAAPTRFDPILHPDAALARRNYVLDRMATVGDISQATADAMKAKPVKTAKQSPQFANAAYFVDYTRDWLQKWFGYEQTFGGGLRVRTTLNLSWQRAAEHAIATHLSHKGDPEAALVAIDPRNGAIRAMVGGKYFHRLQAGFNIATDLPGRETGSAFKLFTLSAAIEQRFSPFSTWSGPPSIVINDPRCYDPTTHKPWDVSNSADESAGTMSLEAATWNSVNTIFAQLVTKLADGPADVAEIAHRMGIRTALQPVCSITLGTQDARPIDMADGYATVADRGVRHDPNPVASVKNADGLVLARPHPKGVVALRQNDADLVTSILEGVIQRGTGTRADIGRPAAGKTGTGENYDNAWFCGYTPQLTTCVWVGYRKGSISMTNIEGFPAVFGGTIPAEIWHDFMSQAMAHEPVKDFPTPSLSGYDRQGPAPAFTPSPSPSPKPPRSPKPTKSPKPTRTTPPPTTTTPPPTTSSATPAPSGNGGAGMPAGAALLGLAPGLLYALRRRARP